MFASNDPSATATSTVVTTSNTTPWSVGNTNRQSNPSYIRSVPGGLKIGALIINIIVCICVSTYGGYNEWSMTAATGKWTLTVSVSGLR